ncbi:MAG: sigma-54-dependent Fis family transcriptional regulator [Candidatus Wallbacteria bacterium]|nr:sigma-54-dependent Fis family transcriptional regulator [Candidatus Wallbacteria bacterium]
MMIVDDEVRMTQILAMVFDKQGYKTTTFNDPEKALAKLAEDSFDLLVTDLSMPGMDGLELLRRAKALRRDLPVVLITAHATVKSAVTAMKDGAFDYILKPFENDELKNIAANALEMSRLSRENQYLKGELKSRFLVDGFVAEDPKTESLMELVKRVAPSKATVLVRGESGTGKEMVARALHMYGDRVGKPFLAVNCKALSESLLETEIFGHEKGAFTGAAAQRKGRFELAHQGTLFLDEIGEVSEPFQAKLLRVLQEGEFERVGGTQTVQVDVRVVAATNRDLEAQVREGKFRDDLYFRLNVIPIVIPPLRERRADILPLAQHFLRKYSDEMQRPVRQLSSEVREFFESYHWPGNVRELENTVERGVVLARGAELSMEDIMMSQASRAAGEPAGTDRPLSEFLDGAAADYIRKVLDENSGKKLRSAELLGIDRATLYRLMKKYGIAG